MQHPFQAAEVQRALLHSLLFPFHVSYQQQATVPRLQVQHLQELQFLPEEGEGLDLQCLPASKVRAYCSATCVKQLWPDLSFPLYLSVVNAGGIVHEVPVYVGVDLFLRYDVQGFFCRGEFVPRAFGYLLRFPGLLSWTDESASRNWT